MPLAITGPWECHKNITLRCSRNGTFIDDIIPDGTERRRLYGFRFRFENRVEGEKEFMSVVTTDQYQFKIKVGINLATPLSIRTKNPWSPFP